MSYDIIYQNQLVRLENHPYKTKKECKPVYIPFIEVGCSNLYDYNNKRVRNWNLFQLTLGNLFFDTEKSLLNKIKLFRDQYAERYEDYTDKTFGYYAGISVGGRSTYNTTFGNFEGIIKTGVKRSLTIEQLTSFGCSICFEVKLRNPANEDVDISVDRIYRIKNEFDFWKQYVIYKKALENTPYKLCIVFDTWREASYSKDRNARFFPVKKRQSANEGKFTIVVYQGDKKLGFLSTFTATSVRYNSFTIKRRYETEYKALSYIKSKQNKLFKEIRLEVQEIPN